MGLSDADLAYMRDVQGEHHPTAFVRVEVRMVPDGQGGQGHSMVNTDEVMGRFDAAPERIPDYLTDVATKGPLGTLSLDFGTDVRKGDLFAWADQNDPRGITGLEVVSEGRDDRWTTATVVWVLPFGPDRRPAPWEA